MTALSANQESLDESHWSRDVAGVSQIFYSHSFPEVLSTQPDNFASKVKYRLVLKKMLRKSKGTPYDRALFDEGSFKEALSESIESIQPDIVVVTGAPFLLLKYAADLRKQFPQVLFVADFRDPWTWGASYGYQQLSPKRLHYEKEMEQKVCDTFDLIVSPWPEIIAKLKQSCPTNSTKMQVLSHGFDPDDLNQGQVAMHADSVEKILIYGGTIYEDFIPYLEQFGKEVEASNRIRIHIYSSEKKRLGAIPGIELFDPLPSAQFFQKAREADWLLFPIPERLKNGVPTKLYEYAALGKPILAFGSSGEVSNFIQEKGMGCYLRKEDDLESVVNTEITISSDKKWIKEFSIDQISKDFLEMTDAIKRKDNGA